MEWYDKLILALVSLNVISEVIFRFIYSPEEKKVFKARLKLAEAKSYPAVTEILELMQKDLDEEREKVKVLSDEKDEADAKAQEIATQMISEREQANEIINDLKEQLEKSETKQVPETVKGVKSTELLNQLSGLTGPAIPAEFLESMKIASETMKALQEGVNKAMEPLRRSFAPQDFIPPKGVKVTSVEEVKKGMIPGNKKENK